MGIVEQTQWEYNPEYSYEANMNNWIDAVNFERKQHEEEVLSNKIAEMKFQEIYPRSDYGKT